MWTRASGAVLGAGLAVLALLALPSSPSLADQTAAEQGKPAESGSTVKKPSPQTKPTQTRPAKRTAPAKKPATPKTPAKPLVFTDEDLKKYHTGDEGPATRKASPPPTSPDPLKPFKDKAEKERWRQARAGEFQKNIQDLEGKLKFLEQKRLSIQNPLVPRPTDPSAEPDTDEGLSGEERLAKNDQEIRDTRQKLEAARKELATFLEANPE
jgi:hypothetical protein